MGQKVKKKKRQSLKEKNVYFAAPNDVNEVIVTYSMNDEKKKSLSLSVSDENHIKYLKKMNCVKTEKSMAAINDATKTSLLEDVNVTTSQTLQNEHLSEENDEDEHVMHGNFAN